MRLIPPILLASRLGVWCLAFLFALSGCEVHGLVRQNNFNAIQETSVTTEAIYRFVATFVFAFLFDRCLAIALKLFSMFTAAPFVLRQERSLSRY